jgi:hypothetical protein
MYKLNLLPVELQRDLSIDIKGLVRRVTITVAIFIVLASYGMFLFMGYLTQREINDTQKYLNQISATVKKVEGIKAERVKNEENTKKFKEILGARQARFPILEDLNYNMPVDLWLENVSMSYVASGQAANTAANASGGATQTQPVEQSQTQGQAAAKKEAVSPPLPNTLIIEGYSLTVPSIGIFMNNLYLMPYFTSVVLNELKTDEKSGNIKFKLTAVLKEGGR